ncbi:Demethylsterigmatocystin 6-O-methyltransferase [Mycena venus]|uniref:Demethylsterigmatocystin 6-O-methyltransferase n=1 Tax=Mycena venus TaxID=2733690 RepID=A0A8H6Y698_9AGAR|nr:Demethylsterigmatocystin 6-O-methyltransferase [Mycena venus]
MALSGVDKIINVLDSISPDLNVQEHTQVIEALRRTLNRLQTPFERAWEMIIPQPLVFAACQTTIDLGLWEAWRSAGGGQKSLDELAELCNKNCNPNLLRRLMRLLVARNVVEETGLDMFQPTAFSLAMGDRSIALTLQSGTHHWIPTALEVPSHLAQTAYQESTDANNTAYIKMTSNPEKLDFFARCGRKPEYQESFVQSMSTATAWKQNWTDYFDTSTLVDESVLDNGKNTPIFVEIGGNTGVDVTRFLEKHPDVPDGSLVLQDLDDVISMVKVDPKIRVMAHDFFKPQPVINSRIYFLHAILHDWPDALALQILSNLVPAFKKGYSKLLIADVVIPPEGASAMQAAQDLLMMGLLSAGERTEAAWSKLLNTAGFKVVKVWKDSRKMECVIEAELE